MNFTIALSGIAYRNFTVQALLFIPERLDSSMPMALFTHGYTDHKGSLVNWGARMAKRGIPTLVFDLPGHYLGSFNEVASFDEFSNHAHFLFEMGARFIEERLGVNFSGVILGGHSLGALMALRAADLPYFSERLQLIIPVGFGFGPGNGVHMLESPIYAETMKLRTQLVSPVLAPSILFPWLKKEKELLSLKGRRVHLICGENDGIIFDDGVTGMESMLLHLGNAVTITRPKRLPHHLPDLAAVHVDQAVRKFFNLS